MNFVFISPQFPETYWLWCDRLRSCGASVYGIGDTPAEAISSELHRALDEYVHVDSLENYDQVFRAVAYLSWKHGHMDWIESMNEHWLPLDARLRDDFHVTTGASLATIDQWQSKAQMKPLYAAGNVPTARQVRVGSLDEARHAVWEWGGFPAFAKPEYGVGAGGAMRIDNDDQLRDLVGRCSWQGAAPYVLEEFVPASGIAAYDAIIDPWGKPVFENQEEFPPSMSDVARQGLDLSYYCCPGIDPRLRDLGHAAVHAFGVRARFVHLEFFRLAEDREGLGHAGDYVGLEVNCRPAGGYTPDMMNFAHSTDVYRIWAEMVCFGERRLHDAHDNWFAVYASRRDNHTYAHSHREILARWGGSIMMERRVPGVLSDDMGNHMYVARVRTEAEREEFIAYVQERAPEGFSEANAGENNDHTEG